MDPKAAKTRVTTGEGFLPDLLLQARLIGRLMLDRRVNPWIKFIPLASVLYCVIPDLLPGPVDDTLVVWIGATVFLELCPPVIVEEHTSRLLHPVARSNRKTKPPDDVIDAEFRDLGDR